jgi:inner membrane protein
MFIGHLPAAYLAFKAFAPKSLPPAAFAAGRLGGVLPDIDMLWFVFVDSSHHHHDLITHRPIIWVGLGAISYSIYRTTDRLAPLMALCASIGALFHLVMDSIAGKISWFWPLSDWSATLVQVQATHSHWIKSFLHHWTFKVEIAVTLVALAVLFASVKRRRTA